MGAQYAGGPSELILTASVARRYYLDGRSKVEIAGEFDISRFKVARLLENARSIGLVRIEIGYPGVIDVDLSARLRERFSLERAIVVDTPEDYSPSLRRHLGRATAELLSEILGPRDVLGLAWARSVSTMAGALSTLPAVPVVQLTGALSRPDMDDSSIELVREVARRTGGPAYFFYAPLIVADAATARALRQQPEVARAFDQLASVTKAVAGIGQWQPAQSTLYDAIGENERQQLRRLGVRADIFGILLSAEGNPVRAELTERMVCVSAAQIEAVPEVIAIAYGDVRAPAVCAALRSGLVDTLVTHVSLATALLAEA